MENKEAIKQIKELKQIIKEPITYSDYAMAQKLLSEVIELLKRGEKFEKMWKELRALKKVGRNPEIIVKELEQKYFPEEVNK